jgi:acetyl esterase/lipase
MKKLAHSIGQITFILCLLMTAAQVAVSQISESIEPTVVIDVWTDGTMPGKGAGEPEAEMPAKGDNVQRITNISRPTLSFFPVKKKNAPAVIICPGGGYNYVTYNKEGVEVAEWLNSLGISALVLKYRTPKNRDGAFQDLQRALSLTRANAKKWNIDAQKVGVIGFSAGGHLAAKASNLFAGRSYSPIDSVDKKSSRPDFVVLVYPAYLEREGKIAAELNLKAKIPPTLIVHNEDDKNFIAGSRIYQAALDEAKIKNTFLLYRTGGHGYGLRSDKDAGAWTKEAAEWLKKNVID